MSTVGIGGSDTYVATLPSPSSDQTVPVEAQIERLQETCRGQRTMITQLGEFASSKEKFLSDGASSAVSATDAYTQAGIDAPQARSRILKIEDDLEMNEQKLANMRQRHKDAFAGDQKRQQLNKALQRLADDPGLLDRINSEPMVEPVRAAKKNG
tara:strand:+ start:5338 stop:5802 length:465 start_codon:yes stop_codon:yes gene_type:complete